MIPTRDTVETYEAILRKMACTRCGIYCKPFFTQCTTGHIICTFCCGAKTCRFCHQQNSPFRIFVLDNIHHMMTFPCTFRYRGCNFKGKFLLLQNHLTECNFRVSFCALKGCNWTGEAGDIFRHFMGTHNNIRLVKIKSDKCIKIIESEERRFIIKDLGIIFLVVFSVSHLTEYVQCYATNFDNSFNCIEHFETIFQIKLRNGATFIGKIPCQPRVQSVNHWQNVSLGSKIDQSHDFVINFRLNDQYVTQRTLRG